MSESLDDFDPPSSRWRKAFWWILSGVTLVMISTLSLVDHSGPTLSAVPFFSSVFFFCCVLGGWFGLGHGAGRLILPAILPALLGYLVDQAVGGRGDEVLYGLVYAAVAFVAFATFTLRLTKGRLVRVAPGVDASDALQFGIKDVMIWTTVVAVLLTIGRVVIGANIRMIAREPKLILVISIALGVATVVNIWAMHGKTITSTKLLVVFVFTILAALFNVFAMDQEPWFFPLVVLVCETLVIGLMYCLRQDGYRFVKR